jgi:hypothetical protein
MAGDGASGFVNNNGVELVAFFNFFFNFFKKVCVNAGPGDENDIAFNVIVSFKSVVNVFKSAFFISAAIFFTDFHFAFVNFDTGFEFKKVCAKSRNAAASSAFVKEFELVENKACVNAFFCFFDMFENRFGAFAFCGKFSCTNNKKTESGRKVFEIFLWT